MRCPGCGKSYKVPDEYIGRRVKCQKCGETFVAPAPEAATAASPATDPPHSSAAPPSAPPAESKLFSDAVDEYDDFEDGRPNLDELLETLENGKKKERREAARQIRDSADPAAADALMDYLGDKDAEVRRLVAEAFGEIGGKIGLAGLIGMAYDEDLLVRLHAYEGMVHIPEAASLELSAYFDLADMVRFQFDEMWDAVHRIGSGKLKETPYVVRRLYWRCDSMCRNPYFEDALGLDYKLETKKYRSHFAALCEEFGIDVDFD